MLRFAKPLSVIAHSLQVPLAVVKPGAPLARVACNCHPATAEPIAPAGGSCQHTAHRAMKRVVWSVSAILLFGALTASAGTVEQHFKLSGVN